MSKQPEAMRIADELEMWTQGEPGAVELRRQYAEIERLTNEAAAADAWSSNAAKLIRDLTAERDAALAKSTEQAEKTSYWTTQSEGWRARAVKAECKLAALAAQEPVVFYSDDWKIIIERRGAIFWPDAKNPLYAAAGAAPVPEGWQLVPVEPTHDMVIAAMNVDWSMSDTKGACIDQWQVMLSAAPKEPS